MIILPKLRMLASSSSFFLSFFRRLISEVAERNSTKISHMLGSNCDLKRISKIWGIPFPYKSGAQNHLFEPTSQLSGKFNGLYLRNETLYRQSAKCVDNYKESPTSSQNVMNFGAQTALKNSTCIYPPSVNYAFCDIARLRRRRSANRTQPNFAKRRTENRANNLL